MFELQVLASAVDTWATVAVAIGTLGAVGYALFRDLVLERRRRPRLELRFDAAGHDRIAGKVADADTANVRLRLSNGPGRNTADDVVVIVTEVRRLEQDTVIETTPIGLPLAWSGSSPRLSVASVHPGAERHIDLLHVSWPGPDEGDAGGARSAEVPLQLDVAPEAAGGQHLLGQGTYEVDLEVRSRNADASRYTVAIGWDGEQRPAEGQMWNHLRVDPPRKRA